MRYRRKPEPETNQAYQPRPIPIDAPVAVYYRQSSDAQVGNISTTLQTVDMVEHLISQGWQSEHIVMIDMDAGISGTKTIAERPGMSALYAMIEKRQVHAVAAQDVDRFFRDITQIETNKFIEACRANNVMVLTPTMVYDFSHPTQGRYHVQMFRSQAERAVEYLEHHVKGRLVQSRAWLLERGMWAGRPIPLGFLVDLRKHLPNGTPNPLFKKYVPFEPYAEVIRAYYEIFRQNEGSAAWTWDYVQAHGPYYPEFEASMVPEGFKFRSLLEYREPHSGRLMPSPFSWKTLLTNVAYIGHWVHQGAIIQWHNHPALVDEGLFMFAFNRLSATDFMGDPNPDHRPFHAFKRAPKEERSVPKPTYSGLVFSDDVPDKPHRRVAAVYDSWAKIYKYQLYVERANRSSVWTMRADILDKMVDEQLLKRLKSTIIDENLWQEALQSAQQGQAFDRQRLQQEVKKLRQEQDNIIATLRQLTHAEMVQRLQADYELAGHRIEALQKEIDDHKTVAHQEKILLMARPALEKIIQHWEAVSPEDKRQIFEDFAKYIHVSRLSSAQKVVTIHWRDGEVTEIKALRESRGFFWDPEMLATLKELVERPAPQAEILQAFPEMTWRNLMERYAYHYGSNGKVYGGLYKGKLDYPIRTRWQDTREYHLQAQLSVTKSPSDR